MLTEFNTGGSHEQNKYGGIPQGMSSNGKLNKVEQGETKKDNFIYSDRLYINEDLIKESNLPLYIRGKSFANASKSINDKFKDRNDIHSKATQKELLNRLARVQEEMKLKQDEINSSMNNNMSDMEYEEGGFMNFLNNNSDIINKIPNLFESSNDQTGLGLLTDSIGSNIADSYGTIGSSIFAGKKLGESIGNMIGGKAGAITSSIFSPEKSIINNLMDKNLSAGERALGMLPGVGGFISNKSKDRQLRDLKNTQNRKENFYKYQFNENNNDVKTFALGGEMFGEDPVIDPKKAKKSTIVNTSIGENENLDEVFRKKNEALIKKNNIDIYKDANYLKALNEFKSQNNSKNNSRYLNIVGMQRGVDNPKYGKGAYFFSGKTPQDPGFNIDANREFIKEENIQDYLNSQQGQLYLNKLKKQIADDNLNKRPIYSYSYLKPVKSSSSFAYGGKLGDPKDLSINDEELKRDLIRKNDIETTPISQDDMDKFFNYKKPISNSEIKHNKLDYSKILNNSLRYAPILGNILQKNRIGAAEVDNPIRNNYQYKKQLLDTNKLENIATQEAVNTNEVLSKSGLTSNQLLSAMLGSQLNRTKSISDAYNKINEHNINENKIDEQIKQNQESDFINDLRYVRETNAQNRANRDTQLSKFDSEIYNSLGEIGKEEIFKKMAEKMTGYDWMGKYLKENPNATPEEAEREFKKQNGNKKSKGGYLNINFRKY